METYIVKFKDGGYESSHIATSDSIINAIQKACEYLNYSAQYCVSAQVLNPSPNQLKESGALNKINN